VQTQDECPFLGARENFAVGVPWVLSLDAEALVVIDHERRQKSLGGIAITDPMQTQFLDQPILKGLIGPLDPTLGLGTVGMDRVDVEGLEGTRELSQLTGAPRRVDSEDTRVVPVDNFMIYKDIIRLDRPD